jgi:hypothetical protein
MAEPNSRETLKQYCLRKLGHPVINIEVDNDQLDDRIDDALQKYKKHHYDGTELLYVPHQITATDISYKYIPVDSAIERVVRVCPINSSGAVNNMFNFNYQFRLNDMRSLIQIPTTNYYITQQHLQLLQDMFVGELSFEFNRPTGKLRLNVEWGVQIQEGDWILNECYVKVDPDTYTKIFNDTWLKEYTTALFKEQWANHLKKFGNLQLPGGVVLNGDTLYNEAVQEIKDLEADLRSTYEPPAFFIVG